MDKEKTIASSIKIKSITLMHIAIQKILKSV